MKVQTFGYYSAFPHKEWPFKGHPCLKPEIACNAFSGSVIATFEHQVTDGKCSVCNETVKQNGTI